MGHPVLFFYLVLFYTTFNIHSSINQSLLISLFSLDLMQITTQRNFRFENGKINEKNKIVLQQKLSRFKAFSYYLTRSSYFHWLFVQDPQKLIDYKYQNMEYSQSTPIQLKFLLLNNKFFDNPIKMFCLYFLLLSSQTSQKFSWLCIHNKERKTCYFFSHSISSCRWQDLKLLHNSIYFELDLRLAMRIDRYISSTNQFTREWPAILSFSFVTSSFYQQEQRLYASEFVCRILLFQVDRYQYEFFFQDTNRCFIFMSAFSFSLRYFMNMK